VGPSRLGKTVWARSLGKHMYMSNMFSLDQWNDKADYLICDDISWKYFPSAKMLLGGQQVFTMSDKYARKRTVNWGKPCIYLMNNDNYLEMASDPIWAWLEINCMFVFITNKLY
jgi:hypothetical protein